MLTFKKEKAFTRCKICFEESDRQYFDILRNLFKTENKKAKFVQNKNFVVDPYTYAIKPLGAYNTGMTIDIIRACIKFKIPYKIDNSLLPFLHPTLNIDKIEPTPNKSITYRDYQLNFITLMSKMGCGLIKSPTRSGKSLTLAGLCHNTFLNFDKNKIYNILLLVPNVQLVSQMYNDFINYGLGDYWNIQRFSSKFPSFKIEKNNVFIVNHKWLLLHGDQLPAIDMLLCDEVHQITKGSQIGKVVQYLEIKHKFGCTGTLPDSDQDLWYIKGIFGPVLDQLSITELQNKKVLADVVITPIQLIHKHKRRFIVEGNTEEERMESAKSIYRQEVQHLISLDNCNLIGAQLAERILQNKPHDNVLILFDYIEHGTKIFELLQHKKKFYIDGTIDVNNRQDIVQIMNDPNGGCITVANARCFGTGLTIKHIQHIIIFNCGRKSSKYIQCIGRGLERNKQYLYIYDLFHNYKYSEKHFKERTELYKQFYNKEIDNDYKVK